MRNILGLIVGGFVGMFAIGFISALLSSLTSTRSMFMDNPDRSPWPLVIALPLGIFFGYMTGKEIAKPKDQPPDDE